LPLEDRLGLELGELLMSDKNFGKLSPVLGPIVGWQLLNERLDLIGSHEAAGDQRFLELTEQNFHTMPLEIIQGDCRPFSWGASS
jgi:hypothetical protein